MLKALDFCHHNLHFHPSCPFMIFFTASFWIYFHVFISRAQHTKKCSILCIIYQGLFLTTSKVSKMITPAFGPLSIWSGEFCHNNRQFRLGDSISITGCQNPDILSFLWHVTFEVPFNVLVYWLQILNNIRALCQEVIRQHTKTTTWSKPPVCHISTLCLHK